MKRTARANGKPIRQNRPGWRKVVIKRHVGGFKYVHRGYKIKGKDWKKVENEE